MTTFELRPLTPVDFDTFFSLITALADFEKLAPPDETAKIRLQLDAFGASPKFRALLAFVGDVPAGYAIYFETYSSFLAKPTLYLEDLFVLPEYRHQKVALRIFKHLAETAIARGCGRLEFQVLEWNTTAINFYKKLGAVHQADWLPYRMTQDVLLALRDAEIESKL